MNNVAEDRAGRRVEWVLVFALATATYALLAAPVPFYDKGEPREALTARAVASGTGDVALPRWDGETVPSKPPLFHWLAALALRAGVSPEELAIRLPSAVAGGAAVALTGAFAAQTFGTDAGLLSALVVGTSFEWLRAATQARVDMLLTVCLLGAILGWRAGAADGSRRAVWAGWVAAAAGVLSKGPVGVVLPALVVGADALVRGHLRGLRRLVDPVGVAAFIVVCVGWYALAWSHGGAAFVARQVVKENLQRFVGWGHVPHAHGVAYYLPALAGGFMPWTPVAALGIVEAWRTRDRSRRALVVWAGVVLAFYALATGKRSVYLLPLFPPLAALCGARLALALATPLGTRGRAALLVAAAGVVVLAVVVAADHGAVLAAPLRRALGGADAFRLAAVLDTVHDGRWRIAGFFALIASALAVVGVARAAAARRGAVAAAAWSWVVALTLLGTLPVATRTSPKEEAERLAPVLAAEPDVCARGGLDYAFLYYAHRVIPPCRGARDGGATLEEIPDRRRGRNVYVLTPADASRTVSRGPR